MEYLWEINSSNMVDHSLTEDTWNIISYMRQIRIRIIDPVDLFIGQLKCFPSYFFSEGFFAHDSYLIMTTSVLI